MLTTIEGKEYDARLTMSKIRLVEKQLGASVRRMVAQSELTVDLVIYVVSAATGVSVKEITRIVDDPEQLDTLTVLALELVLEAFGAKKERPPAAPPTTVETAPEK